MTARPTVSDPAELIYEALAPGQTYADEANDWQLLSFCDAAAVPLELVWELAQSGWEVVFDVDTCPVFALGYLAQFVGVTLEPAWSEEQGRTAIREPLGFARGRPASIVAEIQEHLTGSKTVLMDERAGGDAYALTIRTLDSETPDPARVESEILKQKPDGIILDYDSTSSRTFADLDADYASFTAVDTAYDSFEELEADV
jgi:hypothetical protein